MVVGHLVAGVALGLLAAVASLALGFSLLATFGFYVLGGNVGLALSVAVRMVRPQTESPRLTFIDNWPAALE